MQICGCSIRSILSALLSSTFLFSFVCLSFLFTFLCTSSFAQQYPYPGFPPFSTQVGSQYDFIDLADSNISMSLPLRNKYGPIPFSSRLFGASNAYTFLANNTSYWEITSLAGVGLNAFTNVTSHLGWTATEPTTCNGVADWYYSAFTV